MGCDPGADQFIEDHFKDCVYNVRDYIGFCLGLAAIVFWVIAQLPQYYRNYKTKSAEALSPWFLAQWLLGDTFNLIGALLQGQQLPTTVYTAMYFVIADMFMMMQYIYYGALQRRREQVLKLQARRRHHHRRNHHHRHQGDSSSREREGLLEQHAHSSSPGPGGGPAQQQREQQPQGQSLAWPSQQQERRRVPHAGPDQCSSPQAVQDAAPPMGMADGSSKQQQAQHGALPGHLFDSGPAEEPGSCSDSDCSGSSQHSSSKGPMHLGRHGSPARDHCEAAAGSSCGAAAAASTSPYARSMGGVWVPFGGMHWGGVRSVIAVSVLVGLGLVSLLPASSTRALVPLSLSGGPSGAGLQAQPGSSSSLSARTMQAGAQQQQQQGSSIHLSAPLLDPTTTAAAAAGSTDRSGGSSEGSSSSSSRKGWSRQSRGGGGDGEAPERSWSFIVGTGLGYVASVLYLCSRISQIRKNHSRKSSEGLALVMFIMAVCANLCTGTSIILRTFTWEELKEQLPWIIGSLGTISLDMIILWQSTAYSKGAQQQGGEHQHGAAGGGSSRAHHPHHHHHGQHTVVDVSAAAAAAGVGAAPGVDSMPLPPHHRGALLGRRHAAVPAAGDLAADGPEVAAPLIGPAV